MPRPSNNYHPPPPAPPEPSPHEGGTARLPQGVQRIAPWPFCDLKSPVDDATFIDTMTPILTHCAGVTQACRIALSSEDGRLRVDAIGDGLEVVEGYLRAALEIFVQWQEGAGRRP
jgi:hypothetical protein